MHKQQEKKVSSMEVQGRYLWIIIIACMIAGCALDPSLRFSERKRVGLSVEEARQFLTAQMQNKTRNGDLRAFPFVLGDPVLNWEEALISETQSIACVDVPITDERKYVVLRFNRDDSLYSVGSYAKIVVVKSFETAEIQSYIRICIPEEYYDGLYEGNL